MHGRNNYRRVAVVILYSLYKQMAFVTSLFLYNIVNGWSAAFALPSAARPSLRREPASAVMF